MNDTKKCPYCGKQLHTGAQYCMYCMHSLQKKKDVTPKTRLGGMKILLPVLVVAILLAVSCVGGGLIAVIAYVSDSGLDSNIQISSEDTTPKTEQSDIRNQETEEDPTETTTEEPTSSFAEEIAQVFQKPDSKPVVTAPESSKPDTVPTVPDNTEPIATTPAETQPEQTQQCSHYYAEATCVAPMTCILCGDTRGAVDADGHNWEAETATVHHKEVGHYEEQVDYVKKTKYLCFFCGYNQDGFYTMDALREHITVHSHYGYDYDLIVKNLELNTDTREVWEPVTEMVWVVDQEAYDETIVTGYTCSICKEYKST